MDLETKIGMGEEVDGQTNVLKGVSEGDCVVTAVRVAITAMLEEVSSRDDEILPSGTPT